MAPRDELEEQAREHADFLLDYLVQRSESVDYRQGTFLLAALAAELGTRVQLRCWELARTTEPSWEIAGSEAETLINAAWRCMATIAGLSDQEDRHTHDRQQQLEHDIAGDSDAPDDE
ncbi:MAG: hypothetical protein IT305_08740 [Chloroflexi bacterium]|nr:hypothetical protein [Chloroflexota bacterium]